MGRRNDHSREEIRQMALNAGVALLQEQGIAALSARKIAARIDYTVGTLYLVFDNLDDLILQINLRTLELLREQIDNSIDNQLSPLDQLKQMAGVYLDFARQYEDRWRLVYEHTSQLRNETYEAYTQVSESLLVFVQKQVARIATLQQAELEKQARALWGGVHGICILALSGKLHHHELPIQDLINLLVEQFVGGIGGDS
jgi:AcrR family transcriptional regulator